MTRSERLPSPPFASKLKKKNEKDARMASDEQLKSFVSSIEALEEQIKELMEDKKRVFFDTKNAGFDPKILKTVLRLRKMSPEKREEEEALIDVYMRALEASSRGVPMPAPARARSSAAVLEDEEF